MTADHPDVAQSRLHLAHWEMEQGSPAEAIRLFQLLLERHEKNKTLDTAEGAELILRYSIVLTLIHDPEGIPFARRGLATRERIFGSNHRETVIAKLVLATGLFDQREMKEAMKLYTEATQTIAKDPAAQNDTIIQATLEYQKAIVQREIFPALALPSFKKAEELIEQVVGTDHVYVGVLKYDHASLLADLGSTAEAEKKYRECIEISRKTLTIAHPRVLVLIRGYSDFLYDNKRSDEGWKLIDEAYQLSAKQYPNEFRYQFEVTCIRGRYAARLKNRDVAMKDADAAIKYARQLKREMTHGEQQSLVQLADKIADLPDVADGRSVYRRFGEPGFPKFSVEHQIRNAMNFGCALFERGAFDESAQSFQKAFKMVIPDKIEQADSGLYAYSSSNYGKILWQKGDFAEAEKYLRQALVYRKKEGTQKHITEANYKLLSFLAIQRQWKDIPALAKQYGDIDNLPILSKSFAQCIQAIGIALDTSPDKPKFDLDDLETKFGSSKVFDVMMYRARAVYVLGGDIQRERQRLTDVIVAGKDMNVLVETQANCDILLGDFAKAKERLQTFTVFNTAPYRQRSYLLRVAYCEHRVKPTPETLKKLNDELQKADEFAKTGPHLKDPQINGFFVSHALELEWWMRHIQAYLKKNPK